MYRESLKGLLQSFVVELLRIRNVQEDMPKKVLEISRLRPHSVM